MTTAAPGWSPSLRSRLSCSAESSLSAQFRMYVRRQRHSRPSLRRRKRRRQGRERKAGRRYRGRGQRERRLRRESHRLPKRRRPQENRPLQQNPTLRPSRRLGRLRQEVAPLPGSLLPRQSRRSRPGWHSRRTGKGGMRRAGPHSCGPLHAARSVHFSGLSSEYRDRSHRTPRGPRSRYQRAHPMPRKQKRRH